MAKYNTVHLFDKGRRFPHMISQGLWNHPDIEVQFSKPFISLGRVICEQSSTLFKDLINCDLIFRSGDQFYNYPEINKFLTDKGLWRKVLYYDFKDECTIDHHRLEMCGAYYKRSWLQGIERKPIPKTPKPILPLDYCVLDEYLAVKEPSHKDKNVVYLVLPNKQYAVRRYCVYLVLKAAKFSNSIIGSVTMQGRTGRRAIFAPPENNGFIEYLKMLKRAKILFTAFPDLWDGDSRTWETFSSGSLVFMDTTWIPSPHPIENRKHCVIYNALSQESLFKAVELARYYLENEAERQYIARTGKDYVLKYHRPVNRVTQMLKWFFDPDKVLEEHVILPSTMTQFI